MLAGSLLLGGRLIRHHLLITPAGDWRDHLWLDEVVLTPPAAAADEVPRPELTAPLPVNTCSTDSLTLLPGVGPVLAGRIDELRAKGHIFRIEEDLRLVKGIGPALSVRLAPLIDFGQDAPADTLAEDSPKSR